MKKLLSSLLAVAVLLSTTASMTAFAGMVVFADEETPLDYLAPNGLSVTDDILYITDGYTNQIYTYDGETLTLLAGNLNIINSVPTGGYIDGVAEYTLFDNPYTAVSWNGGVIVSDTNNNVLRFIKDGVVETYAGSGDAGYTDGTASESEFYLPCGLAVDDQGTLYVADTGNSVIRSITVDGIVSTYATDFSAPSGLYWYQGILYVTDIETNQILSVEDGVVSVIAGQAILQDDEEWVAGYQDGATQEAMFSLPQAIYVDEMGIYVGDTGNNVVRKIASGEVTTLSVSEGLSDPTAIVKYQGVLWVGDCFLRRTFSYVDSSSSVLFEGMDVVEDASALETDGTVQSNAKKSMMVYVVGAFFLLSAIGFIVYRKRKQVIEDNETTF